MQQQVLGAAIALAELGSIQMEFAALSHRTGDPRYAEKAEGMIERIDRHLPDVVSELFIPLPVFQ